MRIRPGLSPKPVTSTSVAADAGGASRAPARVTRVLTSAMRVVLRAVIFDLRSGVPDRLEGIQIYDGRQDFDERWCWAFDEQPEVIRNREAPAAGCRLAFPA